MISLSQALVICTVLSNTSSPVAAMVISFRYSAEQLRGSSPVFGASGAAAEDPFAGRLHRRNLWAGRAAGTVLAHSNNAYNGTA